MPPRLMDALKSTFAVQAEWLCRRSRQSSSPMPPVTRMKPASEPAGSEWLLSLLRGRSRPYLN